MLSYVCVLELRCGACSSAVWIQRQTMQFCFWSWPYPGQWTPHYHPHWQVTVAHWLSWQPLLWMVCLQKASWFVWRNLPWYCFVSSTVRGRRNGKHIHTIPHHPMHTYTQLTHTHTHTHRHTHTHTHTHTHLVTFVLNHLWGEFASFCS